MRIETALLALGTAAMIAAVLYPLVQAAPYWGSALGLVLGIAFVKMVRHDLRATARSAL